LITKIRNRELLKHPKGSIYEDGYGQISKLVMCDNRIHVISKAIYAYLCSYAGGGNQAFPGIAKMCADLKVTKNTLHKYMKELESCSYIIKSQTLQQGNKFANNVYEFVYTIERK
jgi:hypothetical protein